MKFRKTPIALAALAVCGAFAVGAQTSSITIEAENMALSSYVKENTRIKTSSPRTTGTATQKFSGPSGTYELEVHVVTESDGTSTLEVYKGSSLLRSYTYPLSGSPASFTIGNVALNSGDTLKLIGRAQGGMARVDKMVLKPVATSTPSEPVTTTPTEPIIGDAIGSIAKRVTIEAESMALSSYRKEGTRIRTDSPRTTGTATKKFSGASGTYNVQVAVIPETDGQSTLEVYKGSTLLRAYQYPLASTPTSFTVDNVSLKSGETLKLVGTPNAGALARVDKMVFTPVAAGTPTEPAPQPGYSYSGTPYTGSPIAVPKAVPAVNFDKGGQGVAYRDLTQGNAFGLYRPTEDVDINASADALSGGYVVNNFQTGESLAYTLQVPADGAYDLAVRVATKQTSPVPAFHLEVDGVDVTGKITAPNTAGWDAYQWVGKEGVNLKAGKRILKLVSDQEWFGVGAISVLASGGSGPTNPVPVYGVNFKNPAAGATLSGQVNSSGCEVEGSGIASVQFSVDTTALNADSSAPWQCGIDTLKLANGTHTLKALATYTDGTKGSAEVGINVDNSGVTDGGSGPVGSLPAQLLFWSGFESTGLGTPYGCYSNGCWQEFTGGDSRTGFSWPPKIFGSEGGSRFQLMVNGPLVSPSTVDNYMINAIRSVTGPKGNATRALYSEIKKSGCCDTAAQGGSGITQNPYVIYPTREVPELYMSYWVKLQPDLVQQMKVGTWRNLFEWKTTDTDRRASLQIMSYGGTPYWRIKLDERRSSYQTIWEINNKTLPVPAGEWFKVEVYWKRSGGSDGRIWMAINGTVLADKRGSNMGPNNSRINRIFAPILYSGGTSPMYQWVDDMQVWSTFPTARPGDAWYNAPYAPR